MESDDSETVTLFQENNDDEHIRIETSSESDEGSDDKKIVEATQVFE